METTLYIQFDQNVTVDHPDIRLMDIAHLSCCDPLLLSRIRILPVFHAKPGHVSRFVLNAADLIRQIQKQEKRISISILGESIVLVSYEPALPENSYLSFLKVLLVCILSFFGAAFSIMTFNNDVAVGKLLSQIYELVTGTSSDGFTILEFSYSIGIGVGVFFFFNHFGHMKSSSDPTPMQIEMKQYETQINDAMVEQIRRLQRAAQTEQKESAD